MTLTGSYQMVMEATTHEGPVIDLGAWLEPAERRVMTSDWCAFSAVVPLLHVSFPTHKSLTVGVVPNLVLAWVFSVAS
jgi:hypothetical protein